MSTPFAVVVIRYLQVSTATSAAWVEPLRAR
jgi:hypothetical protein